MQRILITGGAGFIGRHLADHLASCAATSVTVIDNESLGDRKHLDLDRVRFISGDLRNRDDLTAAMEGQDVVVHLAADTRVMDSIEKPQHNFDQQRPGGPSTSSRSLVQLRRAQDRRGVDGRCDPRGDVSHRSTS